MLQFLLQDPEPLLYHNEPILRDGEVVGYISSGAYGHWLGGAVGLGYVPAKGEARKACSPRALRSRWQACACRRKLAPPAL